MAPADQQPELFVPSPSKALPDPRLNPLLNPILAQHLGRWAHVYYTNPVERREAAVKELVAELEAEAANLAQAHPNRAAPEIATPIRHVTPVEQAPAGGALRVETPSDAQPNHQTTVPVNTVPVNNDTESVAAQVGAWVKLPAEDSLPEPVASVETSEYSLPQNPPSQDLPFYDRSEETPIAEPLRESVPETAAPVPVSSTAPEDYRAFGEMLAKSDAAMELASFNSRRPARNWQIPLVAAAVLVFLGVSFWVSRGGHARAPGEAAHSIAPATASAPLPTTPVSPSSGQPRVVAQGTVGQGVVAQGVVAQQIVPQTDDVGTNRQGNGTGITPPLSNAAGKNALGSVSPSNIPPVETPPVDPEMVAGMRALRGDGVPRDSAEAVRHFWQSAKNKNGSALVVLAGLYAQGDGVAKDCDQAKVLLDAAARQARSRTQAQRIESTRETLRNSGCE